MPSGRQVSNHRRPLLRGPKRSPRCLCRASLRSRCCPSRTLSGAPERERLADGVTEDIITDLSRFRELFVIARNSTFVYKDKPTDVRQIARELGVQYVLEGSLQADNDRVRITAQLIDATTGNHVWSERYDRPLDDVFAIQDEVTHTIAASLAGVYGIVARARREMARRKPPENLQAYEYYTLGIEHKHQFTEQDNKKARELFQNALQLDPNFARAFVGLAWTHNLDIDFGWTESRQRSLEQWVAAARRAIASDPYDSEARTALGTYYQYLNDFPRAGAEIDQSLELNPNDADRLAQAAWYWTRGGQPDRSLEFMERAVRLKSSSPGRVRRGAAGDLFSQSAVRRYDRGDEKAALSGPDMGPAVSRDELCPARS